MEYKEYLITEFVNEKEQWQAHIRRRDGKHMSVEGTTFPYSPRCTRTPRTRQSELQKRRSTREKFRRLKVEPG